MSMQSDEITLNEWQDIVDKKLDKVFSPPSIGGLDMNTHRISKILSKEVENSHNRRKVSEFMDFLNKCSIQFDDSEDLSYKLEDIINEQENMYTVIFGIKKEDLDRLVIEIQTNIKWNKFDAGSVDLPKLNSHCAIKNRKRLREWLKTQHPTYDMQCFYEHQNSIKEIIAQIRSKVKIGRAHMEKVRNNPNEAKIVGDLFMNKNKNKIIFKGIYELEQLTKTANNIIDWWESHMDSFNNDNNINKKFNVTFNNLMTWRYLRHVKREAIKARITSKQIEPEVSMSNVLPDVLPDVLPKCL